MLGRTPLSGKMWSRVLGSFSSPPSKCLSALAAFSLLQLLA